MARPKSKYLTDRFYIQMARDRGMKPTQVIRRSERRTQAVKALQGANNYLRAVYHWNLDNPFIESHAWKFLVRQALSESVRMLTHKRNLRQYAKSKNTTAEP